MLETIVSSTIKKCFPGLTIQIQGLSLTALNIVYTHLKNLWLKDLPGLITNMQIHSNSWLLYLQQELSITFVPNLYSGSVSDVSIVKESKCIDRFELGDDVMAGRGFKIRHLLLPKRTTLDFHAFSHGKTLSKKAVCKFRKNASVRIHVELDMRL